jgi:rubrerythrin
MGMAKAFADLSEKEILALAISLEEEDARIYADYADGLKDNFPASAKVFEEMAEEENVHRRRLIDLFRQKFGDHIPLIRRQDVRGFVTHEPHWMVRPLGLDKVRKQAEAMEFETRRFYERAILRATDASVRELLGDLAAAERSHISLAQQLGTELLTPGAVAAEEETRRRMFVLQVVQPGLAGLMDGSVSTLAPLFAAAFATHSTWETFLVGLAASVGAGISMGFAEALSDDGQLTGRGQPLLRGAITGAMTALGGLGHTLPYLIKDFWTATSLAIAIVIVELWAIAWIRSRYMDTKFLRAAFEVVVGGLIVFGAGILIGNA